MSNSTDSEGGRVQGAARARGPRRSTTSPSAASAVTLGPRPYRPDSLLASVVTHALGAVRADSAGLPAAVAI
jgi:hypothetical protein